jgi:hypothetical protein
LGDGKKFRWKKSPGQVSADEYLVSVPEMSVLAAHRKSLEHLNKEGALEITGSADNLTELIVITALALLEWKLQSDGESKEDDEGGEQNRRLGFGIGFLANSVFTSNLFHGNGGSG